MTKVPLAKNYYMLQYILKQPGLQVLLYMNPAVAQIAEDVSAWKGGGDGEGWGVGEGERGAGTHVQAILQLVVEKVVEFLAHAL